MGVWSAVIWGALADCFVSKLSMNAESLRYKSFVMVRFLSQQLQEAGVQKELAAGGCPAFKNCAGNETPANIRPIKTVKSP
jgi:hypothetical protein